MPSALLHVLHKSLDHDTSVGQIPAKKRLLRTAVATWKDLVTRFIGYDANMSCVHNYEEVSSDNLTVP